jgi:hypothetical protein
MVLFCYHHLNGLITLFAEPDYTLQRNNEEGFDMIQEENTFAAASSVPSSHLNSFIQSALLLSLLRLSVRQ